MQQFACPWVGSLSCRPSPPCRRSCLRGPGAPQCCSQAQQSRPRSRRTVLSLFWTAGAAVAAQRQWPALADEGAVAGSVSESPLGAGNVVDATGGDTALKTGPATQPAGGGAVVSNTPASTGTVRVLTDDERILLEQNQRIRSLNRAPPDFPAFIRKGYQVTVLADGYTYETNGLIYKDFTVGDADAPSPQDGQSVVFHYNAYNESGGLIDSTYRQGRPAETRMGIGGMIPGFEAGLKAMRVGGKRRIIVPPELGPPVGPGTFFSSKQFEVFDVELLQLKSCSRTQMGIVSTVTCN